MPIDPVTTAVAAAGGLVAVLPELIKIFRDLGGPEDEPIVKRLEEILGKVSAIDVAAAAEQAKTLAYLDKLGAERQRVTQPLGVITGPPVTASPTPAPVPVALPVEPTQPLPGATSATGAAREPTG